MPYTSISDRRKRVGRITKKQVWVSYLVSLTYSVQNVEGGINIANERKECCYFLTIVTLPLIYMSIPNFSKLITTLRAGRMAG